MSRRSYRRGILDVLVIGAGQAGLAMGRELERAGRDFLILDGAKDIGDSWRQRWDSLRLFTPASHSALRGVPFPAAPDHYPTKDEVAAYLRAYAAAFSLPVALDEPVRALHRAGDYDFVAVTDFATYRARQVVVATGGYQAPRVPRVATLLGREVTQFHSIAYRSPSQVPDGPVVVVGGGNSGVQIAAELAATHEVTLAIGSTLPRLPQRLLGRSIFAWLSDLGVLDVRGDSRLGRRVRGREMLIGESPRRIARRLGVHLTARVEGAAGECLVTRGGVRHPARSVIWATGYRPSYPWLRIPVLDGSGAPVHRRGVSAVPGLHFLGLPWQHTRGSALIGWVARDAEYLAGQLTEIGSARRTFRVAS